jgi:TetR/AcrR family transcriptional regulator of autoinduction and epiphytic fitness
LPEDRKAPREPESAALDGRRLRTQRSRERLLDAVESALREADSFKPESIATRAGVSLSTLFRQFGDQEGLWAAMRARVSSRVEPFLRDCCFAGDTTARIHQLVDRHAAAFAELAPFRRAARRLPSRSPADDDAHAQLSAALRVQLHAALGPELEAPHRASTAALVEALLSYEVWEQLRFAQQLDPERVSELLERGVHALLAYDL